MPAPKRKTAKELEAEAWEAVKVRIRDSLEDWYPGKWAELVAPGPACHCGLRGAKERCTRHAESGTDPGPAG